MSAKESGVGEGRKELRKKTRDIVSRKYALVKALYD